MHRGWIAKCLASLGSSSVPISPIVVDNLSTDGTREHVPSKYPDVVWLPQDKNLGFGQANNLGIRYALEHDADYVLLLNQDATIAPDAIEKMLAVSDGKSLLSPLHLNGDGTRIDEMFRLSLKYSNNLLNDDLLIRHTTAPCYESAEICAACWLMPIALIKKIGGFNPLFFHYSEDNNYYHRLVYHGVKTLLVPNTNINHDRLLHGNTQAFNHKKLHRDILLISCNINLTTKRRFFKYLQLLYTYYVLYLPQGKYRPFAWTKEIFWLMTHSGTIKKSRMMEKAEGTTWLNI